MSVVDLSWGVGAGVFSLAGGFLFAVMWMFMFTILIGLTFLLVRFLLVATTAAQIYVEKNKPSVPASPDATPPAASTASAASAPTSAAPTSAASKGTASPGTASTGTASTSTASTGTASTGSASKVVAKGNASQASPASTVAEKPATKPASKPAAKAAAKSPAKPAAAKKAPVKPAGSVPRTPKVPKSSAPKSAPKKP